VQPTDLTCLIPLLSGPAGLTRSWKFHFPMSADAGKFFSIHLKNKPLGRGINVKELASRSDGFGGADISSVCTRAARRAVRRAVQSGKDATTDQNAVTIEASDLEAALEESLQEAEGVR